ncbi:MAG: flagellar hook-length control protein FliK [Candidatus Omnitrophica bacterium]|nr:flagellar hook-length control protein FliK [Candidatus Omnitrophota bacterium]
MRIVNKFNAVQAKNVKIPGHSRPGRVSSGRRIISPDSVSAHTLAGEKLFRGSLFLKLELLLALFKGAPSSPVSEKNSELIKTIREFMRFIQDAKQYSPGSLKNAVSLFSELAKLRAVSVRSPSQEAADGALSKETKAAKEFFEHFQMYEALNRDYEGKTFLAFPLVNIFKRENDIKVFLYLEQPGTRDDESSRTFSFRLDVPTRHMGQISVWGRLQAKTVDIEIEVENERYLAPFERHSRQLKNDLNEQEYILEKILVRLARSNTAVIKKGVEFIA